MLACRALSKGSGSARRLVLRTAAKVNLTLEVLGKRADGYHEIATVMADLELGRKQVRDLDASRHVWATVHRVEGTGM